MQPTLTLSDKPRRALLNIDNTTDSYYAKMIPGRVWRRDRTAWEVPVTAQTLEVIARVLPLVHIEEQVQRAVAARRQWEAEVEQHRDGDRRIGWPCDNLPLITPFDHQVVALGFLAKVLTQSKGAGLWHEMGCGKTLTLIALRHVLMAPKTLILCPASVVSVWTKEFATHYRPAVNVVALTGSMVKRTATLERVAAESKLGRPDVVVCNYEAIWRPQLFPALAKWAPNLIIADEAHRIKTASAQQSIAAQKLGELAWWVVAATGTPVANTPLDYFGLYKFLDETVFGSSMTTFKARYFNEVPMGPTLKVVTGPKVEMLPELTGKAGQIAHSMTKAQALDLPPELDVERTCVLEPAAQKAYNEMRRDCIAFMGRDTAIVAQNALTKILRLSQITGGFVTQDGGAVAAVSTAKLKLLSDTLDDVLAQTEKVVIFARFTAEIEAIRDLCARKKLTHSVIQGSVPIPQRGGIVEEFQTETDPRVMILQIRAGGLGITLHRASTTIFYSFGYELDAWDQARSRVHRIGQESHVTHINLICEGTLDAVVLKALREKQSVASLVVHNWRALLEV